MTSTRVVTISGEVVTQTVTSTPMVAPDRQSAEAGKSDDLSGGAIAGIVIGVLALLALLALAIFFLLLLSLSEHIPFWQAYVVSAACCIGLQGVYLSHVLQSRRRALGFAGMLAALYAVLYGLLVSEDNALLMGALLLFGILAAIMWITRKVDWYALGSGLR